MHMCSSQPVRVTDVSRNLPVMYEGSRTLVYFTFRYCESSKQRMQGMICRMK